LLGRDWFPIEIAALKSLIPPSACFMHRGTFAQSRTNHRGGFDFSLSPSLSPPSLSFTEAQKELDI